MNYDTSCTHNSLPLGLSRFSNIRESNMVYVDKTRLISKIASQRVPIFFSRPRRFGKSLLVNTLASLFSKGLDSFHGLDIEKTWNDKTYPVVHLDFSGIADKNPLEFKKDLTETIIEEFDMVGIVKKSDELGIRSPDRIINEIGKKLKNNSTVLLIDEYDAPLTHHIDKPNELEEIMSILNNFYSTIKQYTDRFRFIFITGITRASHVSIFSAFNNLKDLSLKKNITLSLDLHKEI
ncbi:MAG: AAA family ATPase [Desulfovibrionaceae bacterium]|nr:AAA family ATPase [Desulfovibrionaceae bacterium]